jgi:hypothetical protein
MSATTDLPVGGVELFRRLRELADHYRARAIDLLDHDRASMALALNSLVVAAG